MDIGLDLQRAYDDGYKKGWEEAEAYALHCGDETPITNADRIRAMTDEELSDFCFRITDDVASYYGGNGYEPKYPVAPKGWLDWLRQEVEE